MVKISNEEIIRELQKNARIPAAHIAAKLRVTETAVRKRIQKLEEQKIIAQYTIRTNPKKTGYVHVFIGVDSEPEQFMRIVEFSKKHPDIHRAYTTSGDHTIQLECIFHDNEAFDTFLQELESQQGIKRICPGIITDIIK